MMTFSIRMEHGKDSSCCSTNRHLLCSSRSSGARFAAPIDIWTGRAAAVTLLDTAPTDIHCVSDRGTEAAGTPAGAAPFDACCRTKMPGGCVVTGTEKSAGATN
uniref:Uncharacterized protein n=1 Tax=Anopheles minimus TaxID=112268 RepID=A0A182WPG6_9DIPT